MSCLFRDSVLLVCLSGVVRSLIGQLSKTAPKFRHCAQMEVQVVAFTAISCQPCLRSRPIELSCFDSLF